MTSQSSTLAREDAEPLGLQLGYRGRGKIDADNILFRNPHFGELLHVASVAASYIRKDCGVRSSRRRIDRNFIRSRNALPRSTNGDNVSDIS